jgi:hypothetical protein
MLFFSCRLPWQPIKFEPCANLAFDKVSKIHIVMQSRFITIAFYCGVAQQFFVMGWWLLFHHASLKSPAMWSRSGIYRSCRLSDSCLFAPHRDTVYGRKRNVAGSERGTFVPQPPVDRTTVCECFATVAGEFRRLLLSRMAEVFRLTDGYSFPNVRAIFCPPDPMNRYFI